MGSPLFQQSKQKDSEGVIAATLIGEARANGEKTLKNPLAIFDDHRRDLIPMFVLPSSKRVALDYMRQYEDSITNLGYKLKPHDCPKYMKNIVDLFYSEIQELAQHGKGSLHAAGVAKGSTIEFVFEIERVAPDFLVQKFKGGMDACFVGERELGKSDCNLHHVARPWHDLYERPIVSGVEIANRKDWPRYKYCTTDVELLLEACKLIEKSLIAQQDVEKEMIKFPDILMIRDDIAAAGVARKRATSGDTFNLECLGMVARHFGIGTFWIFQFPESIPTSIRLLISRYFDKTELKVVKSTIRFPGFTESTKLCKIKGRADLKKAGERFFDYYPNRPQVTAHNLDMADILMHLNYVERQAQTKENEGMKLIDVFTTTRKYLERLLDDSDPNRGVSEAEILDVLGWVYHVGKDEFGLRYLPLTYDGIALLFSDFGATKRKIETRVKKVRDLHAKNPDDWPIPANKEKRLEAIKNIIENT